MDSGELDFCKRLPKLELHAHLNGSVSQKTFQELYDHHRQNNTSKVENINFSAFKECSSLPEFFALFDVIYKLTSTPESVRIATERVIEEFNNDNVIYLELRSTPRREENMTKNDYIDAMITGVLNCKKKYPNISVKLLISINRGESVEYAEENINLAIEYSHRYPDIVIGIDMGGNAKKSQFKDFLKPLQRAKNEGLKSTIHCGEIVDTEEVKNILNFSPDRIGHGTCIHETQGGSSQLWNELLEKRIPVELCITSNIKCKTIKTFDKHHFKLLYEIKHPITLATDDKGVFGSDLSEEFHIVQKTFGLTEKELWDLNYKSVDFIFARESEKEMLRTVLSQWKIGNL